MGKTVEQTILKPNNMLVQSPYEGFQWGVPPVIIQVIRPSL